MAFKSKYTGAEVESILDIISQTQIGGFDNFATKADLKNKQDVIQDIDAIRSGAAKGATALQSVPSEYITEDELSEKGYALASDLNDKVDKVTGKQLSTEDFTSVLKAKLEGLSNYDDTTLSNALAALRSDFDKLVSGDSTTAIKTFNEIIAFLDGIADTEDLASIIASIGQQIAGKMDKVTLATVATSGSYNDLSDKPTIPDVSDKVDKVSGKGLSTNDYTTAEKNKLAGIASGAEVNVQSDWSVTDSTSNAFIKNKPTIPSVVTESTVSGWGFTKNTGTYSKPSGGISKSDLASAVQASLGKADTALQSYTEQYKGTVTGVKINGEEKSPNASGVIDLGTIESGNNSDIYVWTGWDGESTEGTITEEEYRAIANAKIVVIDLQGSCMVSLYKFYLDPIICLFTSVIGSNTRFNFIITISDNGTFNVDTTEESIPTATSQLENDSNFVSSDNIKTINGQSILGEGDITIEGGSSNSDANVQAVAYNFDDWMNEPTRRSCKDAVDLTTGEKIYFTGHANYIQCDGGMLMDYIDDKAAAARIIKWDVEAGPEFYMPDEVTEWAFSQNGILILNGGVATIVYDEDSGTSSIQSAVVKDGIVIATQVFSYIFGNSEEEVKINSYPISGGSGGSIDTSNLATKDELAQKQDVISDIDTIRTNAANYKGTVTSVKVDNVSKSQSSGVVDLGYVNKKLTTSTSSSMSLSPNVYYRNTSTSLSSLTITLGSVSNSNIINEYFVEFTTRAAGTTVSLPSTIKWANGEAPTFEAGCTYQISIVNNLGVVTKFK